MQIECAGLTDKNQIPIFFAEAYHLFKCGKGFYNKTAEVVVRIEDKYYQVTLEGNVGVEVPDKGKKTYYINEITNVTYKEILKPIDPKNLVWAVKYKDDTQSIWTDVKSLKQYSKDNKSIIKEIVGYYANQVTQAIINWEDYLKIWN
jgi:hypothetical protein